MVRSNKLRIYVITTPRGYSTSATNAKGSSSSMSLTPSGTLFKTAQLPYFKWSSLGVKSLKPIVQLLKETQMINGAIDVGQSQKQIDILLEDSIFQLRRRRNINVGVLSSSTLLSTLLNDPISNQSSVISYQLRSRLPLLHEKGFVTISYSTKGEGQTIPLRWLEKVGITFIEMNKLGKELDECDLYIVSSPFRVSSVINKGRPVLLLESSEIPSQCAESTLKQGPEDLAGFPSLLPFPKQISRLSTLTDNSEGDLSGTDLSTYMDDYRASGLPDIVNYLSNISNLALTMESNDQPSRLQIHTAYANAAQVISTLNAQFMGSIAQLRDSKRDVDMFLENIEKDIDSLQLPTIEIDGVDEARLKISEILNSRFSWWKLPWRSDDVGPVMKSFVQSDYLSDFEVKLAYEAGRLNALSTSICKLCQRYIEAKQNQPGSMDNQILLNSLKQISIQAPMSAQRDTFTKSLIRRRSQLCNPGGPIDLLALSSQKLLFSFYANCSSFLGLSGILYWTGYVDQWFGCAGIGLFGTLFAARRLQKGWNTAQKKFWGNWTRVVNGIQFDLQRDVQLAIEKAARSAPKTLEKGLSKQTQEREHHIDELQTKLYDITRRESERLLEINR